MDEVLEGSAGGGEAARPRRRGWAIVGVLALILAGGVGVLVELYDPDVTYGEPLPGASFEDASGEVVALSSFEGKVVLLDFWSST